MPLSQLRQQSLSLLPNLHFSYVGDHLGLLRDEIDMTKYITLKMVFLSIATVTSHHKSYQKGGHGKEAVRILQNWEFLADTCATMFYSLGCCRVI